MPLQVGDRMGPYEIVGRLGAGGMGEVYRARDTRLERDVAIKVLPEHLHVNETSRHRFAPGGEDWRAYPELGPSGALLFAPGRSSATDLFRLDLSSGEETLLVEGGWAPRLLASDHLLFAAAGGRLHATRFGDAAARSGSGFDVSPWEERVDPLQWSVSNGGTLVYRGSSGPYRGGALRLAMVDSQTGAVRALAAPPMADAEVAGLSPDGRLVAFPGTGYGEFAIYLTELETGATRRLEAGRGLMSSAVWSPDGRYLYFGMSLGTAKAIYRKRVDGGAPAERITAAGFPRYPLSVTPDGERLLFIERRNATRDDLMEIDLTDPQRPVRPVLATDQLERFGRTSPDGRTLAYGSGPSLDRLSVRVGPYPSLVTSYEVAPPGWYGDVAWSPDGERLFFLSSRGIEVVDVRTEPTFTASTSRVLVPGDFGSYTLATADGRNFLVGIPVEHEPVTELQVIVNWFDELERLVPTK